VHLADARRIGIGDVSWRYQSFPLRDKESTIRVSAERAMNERLNGGCQVPIAGFAELRGEQLYMRGLVGKPDGSIIYRAEQTNTLCL
jgi:hydroxymethylbilane synthase